MDFLRKVEEEARRGGTEAPESSGGNCCSTSHSNPLLDHDGRGPSMFPGEQ